MISVLAISGYRSFRDARIALGPLTAVTGVNGSGKSSLYRALRLLADVAQGRVVAALAREGGLRSTLWAGPETIGRGVRQGRHAVEGTVRDGPIALKLGFGSDDYGYAIDLGLPPPHPPSLFNRDPHIKAESLWTGARLGRANEFAQRRGPVVRIRDKAGAWRTVHDAMASFDSMVAHCGDPRDAAELLLLRERMRDWRFYDHFRTDADAPARRGQIGTYAPVLAGDGADLAAAVATILEIGDADAFHAAVDDAFPGSRVAVEDTAGVFSLAMRQHGLLRPLGTAELSDGTLRFLLLVAALLSPRPPSLTVLNEPESSLHPDLMAPLARLIAAGVRRSQVIVVSHAPLLVDALGAGAACTRVVLEKDFGETRVRDADPPPWTWPAR